MIKFALRVWLCLAVFHYSNAEIVIFAPFEQNRFTFLNQEVDFEIKNKNVLVWQGDTFDFSKLEIKGDEESISASGFPAALINQNLTIKDSRKKILWSSVVTDMQTETKIPKDIIQKMKRTPYFSFCINRESGPQRISICSVEYSIDRSNKNKQWIPRKEGVSPGAEINGKSIGIPQGQILLNDSKNTVYFSMRTSELYLVEIEVSAHFPQLNGLQKLGDSDLELIDKNLERYKIEVNKDSDVYSFESTNSIGLKVKTYFKGPLNYFQKISFKAEKIRRWALPQIEVFLKLPETTNGTAPGGSLEKVDSDPYNYKWTVRSPRSGMEALKSLKLSDGGQNYTLSAGAFKEALWFLGVEVFNVDSGRISIAKRSESLELFLSYGRFFNSGAIIDSQLRLGFTTGFYKLPASWEFRAGAVADSIKWSTNDEVKSINLKLSANKDFASRWFETVEANLEFPLLRLSAEDSKAQILKSEFTLRQSLFDRAWDIRFGIGYEAKKVRDLQKNEAGIVTQLNYSF